MEQEVERNYTSCDSELIHVKFGGGFDVRRLGVSLKLRDLAGV